MSSLDPFSDSSEKVCHFAFYVERPRISQLTEVTVFVRYFDEESFLLIQSNATI